MSLPSQFTVWLLSKNRIRLKSVRCYAMPKLYYFILYIVCSFFGQNERPPETEIEGSGFAHIELSQRRFSGFAHIEGLLTSSGI